MIKSMRIVSWNFLEGGFRASTDAGPRPIDDARRVAAQILIANLNPDVLVLNEALYCEEFKGQFEDYAKLFGFKHSFARLYDGAWGNVILSRFPIVETQHRLIHRKHGQNRGFMAALIEAQDGEALWVSTYHPHPHRRPHKRAEDFTEFLKRVQDAPAILCGDLNAISPEDAPDEAAMVENFLKFQKPGVAENSVRRMIESGTSLFNDVLPAFNWRDAMPRSARRTTLPTALIRRPGDLGLRIDHALVSSHVQVLSGCIVVNADADAASDHYPIMLEVEPVP